MEHRPVVLLFLYKYRGRSIVYVCNIYIEREWTQAFIPEFVVPWHVEVKQSIHPSTHMLQNHPESQCALKDHGRVIVHYKGCQNNSKHLLR